MTLLESATDIVPAAGARRGSPVSAAGDPPSPDRNGTAAWLEHAAADADRQCRDIREAMRRFGDAVRDSRFVGLILDTEGRVLYCNDQLLRLTDWRQDEAVGHDWFERFVPQPATVVVAAFKLLLEDDPSIWHYENEIVTRSGERKMIRWTHSVIRSSTAEIVGTASVGEDVTAGDRPMAAFDQDGSCGQTPFSDAGQVAAAHIVALADELFHRPEDAALPLMRLIAEHCAQVADAFGEAADGPTVAREIRKLFGL